MGKHRWSGVAAVVLVLGAGPSAGRADAENPAGLGVGASAFQSVTGDSVGPSLQLRVEVVDAISFDVGADKVCLEALCAFFGLYRVGAIVHPVGDALRPYAYARGAYFLGTTHPVGDEHGPFDVGPLLGAGLGLGYRAEAWGAYVEAGMISDRDGRDVTERRTAVRVGLEWRFGAAGTPAAVTAP